MHAAHSVQGCANAHVALDRPAPSRSFSGFAICVQSCVGPCLSARGPYPSLTCCTNFRCVRRARSTDALMEGEVEASVGKTQMPPRVFNTLSRMHAPQPQKICARPNTLPQRVARSTRADAPFRSDALTRPYVFVGSLARPPNADFGWLCC